MHTGTISLCDRIAYNIKSTDTKEAILKDLETRFGIRILQRHWHALDDKGIGHIRRIPHLACLRSNGNPYYMYFTRYEDNPIIYFVDKKIQPNYAAPRIILAKGRFDPSLYDNTVLEGEMVKDKQGAWVFLITDVIGWKGKHLDKVQLPHRIKLATQLLSDHYTPDDILDICSFQIKKYAYATKDGAMALLALAEELPYTTRGMYFWPFHLSLKPKLINFDESLIKEVRRKVKDTPDFLLSAPASTSEAVAGAGAGAGAEPGPKPERIEPVVSEAVPGGHQLMYLKKTENPDIYDVLAQPHSQKVGVAHVPTLAVSKRLRAVFKDLTVAVSVPFYCTFNETFQKWSPQSMAPQAGF